MSSHRPRPTIALAHLIAIAALLPQLGGCVIRSFDPRIAEPDPQDTLVAAQTESSDDDGFGVALTSSMPNGHFVASSQLTVIQPDARRQAANFESRGGASAFERQVASRYARGDAMRERAEGGIPLFYASEERRMLSKNAFYNEQLHTADADQNGVISDAEVREYRHEQPRSARP